MNTSIDSIVAACGIATIIINVIGTVALLVLDGGRDLIQTWRRLRSK